MLTKEFDRQVQNLIQKGYPEKLLEHIEPLREKLQDLTLPEIDLEKGTLPFVIVIKSELMDTEQAMSFVGVTKLYPHTPKNFSSIDSVSIPDSKAYLLVDVDRGKKYNNVRPADALKMIVKENRSPLTIDEGVAIITHFPAFLIKNNCFSLLASRHTGDQRVPAIWINSKKQANLGWCWDGNPHTWLGSASGRSRIGT